MQSNVLRAEQGDALLLGEDVVFVRVPPGTRHAFSDCSAEKVTMLVGFTPGRMEHFLRKFQVVTLPTPSSLEPATFHANRVAISVPERPRHITGC